MDLSVFQSSGMWPTIRIHQAIHTEVASMRVLTVIPTIAVNWQALVPSTLIGHVLEFDGVVRPLPDKGPNEFRVAHHTIIVMSQITWPIPHGMRIFTEDERPIQWRIGAPFMEIGGLDFFNTRIHTAPNIQILGVIADIRLVIPVGFIVERPAWVFLSGNLQHGFNIRTITGLIPGRPHNNGAEVLEGSNIGYHAR